MPEETYSSTDWLYKFKEAAGNRAILRRLRTEVFLETVDIAKRGEYTCDGHRVTLNTSHTTKETVFFKNRSPLKQRVSFGEDCLDHNSEEDRHLESTIEKSHRGSLSKDKIPLKQEDAAREDRTSSNDDLPVDGHLVNDGSRSAAGNPSPRAPFSTQFSVVEADCVEIASLMKNAGYSVCMLNMANRQGPGGGVLSGAGAQEENIFRRSNLFQSLFQFSGFAGNFGVDRHPEHSYPLDKHFGGVYSKHVTFFRGSENSGYPLLQNPLEISVVSVPAISNPPLETINELYFIAKDLIEPSKEKIRTILRIGGTFNHDCLVLSAFGCGAFRNPPHHMAELFKDVFSEPEFNDRFRLVVFAIIDDHNTWHEHNPEGNILPFARVFNGRFD